MNKRLTSAIRRAPLAMGTSLAAASMIWASQVHLPFDANMELHFPNRSDITQASAHPFVKTVTGRVKVDRCIAALQAWGRSDDDVQLADKATVKCSAIVKDKDARELKRWINGTGKYSSHKWAWAIVG
jgi:hypothetical protein